MDINKEKHGWEYCPDIPAKNYIEKVKLFVENDSAFSTFRQDPDYGKILEGWHDGGPTWLKMILDKHGDEILKEKLELFKLNDLYGGPTIRNLNVVGNICPFTLKYIYNGLDIKKHFSGKKFKKIVEIGAGYGAMTIILSALYDFDEYILIDLPDVINLCKKYLKHFPELFNKIKFISCLDLKTMESITDIDLFISDSCLAECDLSTQLDYYNKIIKNSKFGYIVYNSLTNYVSVLNYNKFHEIASEQFIIDREEIGVAVLYFTKKSI
jgi:hypothetical protein